MKKSARIANVITTAAFAAALMLAPIPGLGQSDTDKAGKDQKAKAAAKAKALAQAFEANARTLTIYDRQGKVVTTVGPRAIYNTPVFSPDARRLVVGKADLEKETQDLWVERNREIRRRAKGGAQSDFTHTVKYAAGQLAANKTRVGLVAKSSGTRKLTCTTPATSPGAGPA
jgi:hypothetical protein